MQLWNEKLVFKAFMISVKLSLDICATILSATQVILRQSLFNLTNRLNLARNNLSE